MNSQNDKEGSGHIKAAYIAGTFAVIAACITGFFLVLNTMVNNGIIVFGMSNPSLPATATQQQEPISPTSISFPTATQLNVITEVPQPTIQPTALSTSTPELPPPPLPEGYISIGKYYLGMGSNDKAGNQVYSHFISGKIQYTRVMADDDIDKIELVCTDKVVGITERFHPIPKLDGDLFPNYASEVLEIQSNCRIDFYVIDIYGVASGIRVNSEIVP